MSQILQLLVLSNAGLLVQYPTLWQVMNFNEAKNVLKST